MSSKMSSTSFIEDVFLCMSQASQTVHGRDPLWKTAASAPCKSVLDVSDWEKLEAVTEISTRCADVKCDTLLPFPTVPKDRKVSFSEAEGDLL